jgi:hypothetical protein
MMRNERLPGVGKSEILGYFPPKTFHILIKPEGSSVAKCNSRSKHLD